MAEFALRVNLRRHNPSKYCDVCDADFHGELS